MRHFFSLSLVIILINASFAQRNIATFSSIGETQALGGQVFFSANSNYDYGLELYVSDGSSGNFRLVKDISPGPAGSSPRQLTVMNNELYFIAHSPKYGQSVWKSDGTAEGTKVLYSVENSDPYHLMVFKDKLYFTTYLGSIIQTDGTEAGTKVFYQAGFTYGRIFSFIKNENYIYFTENGKDIYRDDGITREHFIGPLSWEDVYFKHLFAIGNNLIAIKSSTYDNVIRVYSLREDQIADGEDAEWLLIKKLDAPVYGRQEIDNFTVASEKLFFSFRTYYDNVAPTDELWVSDGTEAGTEAIKSFSWEPHWSQSEMGMFFQFKGKIFFRSGNSTFKALWTSDGTTQGTTEVHDVVITPPYNDETIPVFADDDKFYFSGANREGNAELWVSDGTLTQQFLDVKDSGGSTPHRITGDNGVVFFVTTSQFSATLWSTLPAPDISVSGPYGTVMESGATPMLFYGSSIGGCKAEQLIIRNKGLKELYLRKIFITGQDFSLKQQSIPEVLGPGESIDFQVVFNPVRAGTSTATLTILSNDEDESNYVINLKATPGTSTATDICHLTSSDVKDLTPVEVAKPVVLASFSIAEGLPIGTLIGELSLQGGGSASYLLSAGEGDNDNQHFFIEGNLLKSNNVFNFDVQNLYSIRIKATTETEEFEASLRIKIINASFAPYSGNCTETIEKMNFSYRSIEFNSLGYLFATTSNGHIIRSMDEGQTWSVVYSNIHSMLGEIFFKGTSGFVQSSNGLLKSDDNGASWFPVYIPFSGEYYFSFPGVFFLTDKKGYVGTEEGEVFFTNDGGRTWEQRLGTNWNEIRDLFFLTENKGYGIAGFGDFIKTEDGGRTWSTIDLSGLGWNTRARDILFLNEDDGFLCTDYKVYKTTNGGRTWIDIPAVFYGEVNKIKFYDDNVGYLYSGYSSYSFYKTTDGGDTWSRITPPTVSGPLNSVAQSSGKIFATNQSYYNDDRARSLEVSSDQGATWLMLDYFSAGDVYRINFSSEDEAIVMGESGIFKTKDKGQSWHQATMGVSNLGDVYFIDVNQVILLSDGHLYKSTDGGATARNVLTTEQSENYYPAGKIYGFTGGVLFSISWYAVYRSEDEGDTWTLVSTDPGYYTQDIHFISSLIGFRTDLFGSVEKTTDGGKTWTSIYTREPTESDVFNAIFFTNETQGYSGGDYLRKTKDGGITWEKIDWPLNEIIAIHFQDESHGYVVTRYGDVYETKDAASTWSKVYSSGGRVFDVQFTNGRIYMAGEDGFLAGTASSPATPAMPGYINGPLEVCAGDAARFNVVVSNNYHTQWNTNADNVEDHNDNLVVRFADPGEYTVTAKHVNYCGTSAARTLTVKVDGPPAEPNIDGPNPAKVGDQDVEYSVTNQEPDTQFIWQVEGSSQIDSNGNNLVIDWSADATQGRIAVLAVNAAGCRTNGSLDIELELPVGAESDLQSHIDMYPNPAETETKMYSSHNRPLLIRVVDTIGREYSRIELAVGEEQILPIRRLPPGLYLVEISDGIQTVSKKLLKK